ncbi:MAG: hypothetical protein LUG19_00465 [Desulfovibrio sp.]|uniref:phosphoribosyltransferase-like protein n=1 Tax=Desulfovibrio sp. TaxID=885 RepID=UPI002586575F|nr:hypothetical protein [Desulfovibrio sp.]MCD7982711.1 hypothetical protein [Desulfovibrio sp.]
MKEPKVVTDWLSQFNDFDRPIAKALLSELRLISNAELETILEQLLLNIAKRYTKGKIAVFPVLEDALENYAQKKPSPKGIHFRGKYAKSAIRPRRLAGSSMKTAYFISNISKKHKKLFAARPTYKCMATQKHQAIVFIDDIIGSGERIKTFWRDYVSNKIKSWLSYDLCDIYFISVAATAKGIQNISKCCRGIKKTEFLHELYNPTFKDKEEVKKLCSSYKTWDNSDDLNKDSQFGYKNSMCNIIFEHKCPNNTPAILWADSKKWSALFKNSTVSKEVFDYLIAQKNINIAEDIWDSGQYKIAYSILDNLGSLSEDDILFMCYLSLIAKGFSLPKIVSIMRCTKEKISEIQVKAINCGAVNGGLISKFGLALLDSFRKISSSKKMTSNNIEDRIIYLPRQYRGKVAI